MTDKWVYDRPLGQWQVPRTAEPGWFLPCPREVIPSLHPHQAERIYRSIPREMIGRVPEDVLRELITRATEPDLRSELAVVKSTRKAATKEKIVSHRKAKTDWQFVETILDTEQVRTIYIYGPPGIGKTYAAYNKGRIDNGIYCITCTEETPAAELRGQWIPKGNEFVWRDGPFTKAMREGARLVINEISHASDDVLAILYPVLESRETAKLTLPTNETVVPSEGFHCVVTDNEAPDQLTAALQDRFDATLLIRWPHPEAIAKLSAPLRAAAERTATLPPSRAISLRSWVKLEELHKVIGYDDACKAIFGDTRRKQVIDALKMNGVKLDDFTPIDSMTDKDAEEEDE